MAPYSSRFVANRGEDCASYTAFRLARLEAASKGFDEAILLNDRGESLRAWWVCIRSNGRQVRQPPLDAGILPSITRRIVLEGFARARMLLGGTPPPHRGFTRADAGMIVGTLDEISHIVQSMTMSPGGTMLAIATIDKVARLYRSHR